MQIEDYKQRGRGGVVDPAAWADAAPVSCMLSLMHRPIALPLPGS